MRQLGFLLLVLLLRTVTGQFDPPCQENCSWTYGLHGKIHQEFMVKRLHNRVGEIQHCEQDAGSPNENGFCVGLFGSSVSDGTAPTAENIAVDYYVTNYEGFSKSYTKLNISFDLSLNGSGIYTGAIIEIRNLRTQPTTVHCQYLYFADDVITDNDLLTQEGSIKRIFFDCTNLLQPGNEYVIAIKTMPYTDESKPLIKYYWTPSCYYRQDDVYCEIPESELPRYWSPSSYILKGWGHKRVELVFDLAPYEFDKYEVYLLQKKLIDEEYHNVATHVYCLNLYVENANVTSTDRCPSQDSFEFDVFSWKENNKTFVQIIWTDVREAVYFVELRAIPTRQAGQQCSTNHAIDCKITTKDVLVEARPCMMVPCPGDYMMCEVEDSDTVVCKCEEGFQMLNETCIVEDDSGEVSAPAATTDDDIDRTDSGYQKIIAAVIGIFFGVLLVILAAWLIYKHQDNSEDPKDKYMRGDDAPNRDILKKRVFIIHSFDHESHNEVVLKLCNFLRNLCKFEVHTALWSASEIGIGVNEWMNTECEEADKVIILCSQGTHIKWRCLSRQIHVNYREDNMGDLFTPFMRLQTSEFSKNSKKFIVAYMDYSTEEHIPQPLKFLQKFKLMDHVERMFYCLNDLEKHSATQDHDCKALKEWDSFSDAGVELKKALNHMKKVTSDPDWFFRTNGISADVKQQLLTKQTRRDDRPNPEVSIICIPDAPQTAGPDSYLINDDDYQMSALNSLRQNASQPDGSFVNGFQSQNDSGVDDISGNVCG